MKIEGRDRLLLIFFLLVAVSAGVFWSIRGHDFIDFDDDYLIYSNPSYKPLTAEKFRDFWTAPQAQIYMPLTFSVWAGLTKLAYVTPEEGAKPLSALTAEFDPGIFHSLNLLLHVLNVLIIFALLRLLIKNDWAAAIGALVWALHPVQVESVAWASELKGVLSGFWGLLALWLYARSVVSGEENGHNAIQPSPLTISENGSAELPIDAAVLHADSEHGDAREELKSEITTRPLDFKWYCLATICFTLALLSKPSAACLPLLAMLFDIWLRRAPRLALFYLLPWLLLTIPIFYMAKLGQPMVEQLAPFWTRPLVMLDALSFYMGKILWPHPLSIEYSRSPDWVYEQGHLLWTWIFPVAFAAIVWWQRRRLSGVMLGLGVFIVALLPVSGLIPFVYQYYSTVADRYLYLPLLGVAVAVSWLLNRFPRRRFFAISGLLLIVLATLTFNQAKLWGNRETFYRHTITVNPRSFQSRINLANVLDKRGDEKEAQQILKVARGVRPKFAEPYNNAGLLLLRRGRAREAIDYFVRAVELSPTFTKAYGNLGEAYITIEQYQFALFAYRRATELEPKKVEMQMRLAEIYFHLKREKEGQEALRRAKNLFPNSESFDMNAALMMVRLERWPDALTHYINAVKARPENAYLHNDVGGILMRLNRPSQAVRVFKNAVGLQPNDAEIRFNLALAHNASGQKQQAIEQLQIALKLNPSFAPARTLLQTLSATSKP